MRWYHIIIIIKVRIRKKSLGGWLMSPLSVAIYFHTFFSIGFAITQHLAPKGKVPQGKVFFSSSSVSTIWQCMVICTWYVPPSPGTFVVQLLPAQKVKTINLIGINIRGTLSETFHYYLRNWSSLFMHSPPSTFSATLCAFKTPSVHNVFYLFLLWGLPTSMYG